MYTEHSSALCCDLTFKAEQLADLCNANCSEWHVVHEVGACRSQLISSRLNICQLHWQVADGMY